MKEILKSIYGTRMTGYKKIKASLPIYLSENKEFYEIILFGMKFIMVSCLEMERLNIASLSKYAKKYYEYFSKDIIYGFPSLTTFQRNALIENDIAFASRNGQVYIPLLGSCFRKCQKESYEKKLDKLNPISQLLILFLIYNGTGVKYNKNEAAGKIGVSPMSVTRATRELKQIGVIQEEKLGNEVFIFCEKESNEVYSTIKPYLINPVQNIIYANKIEVDKNIMIQAGEYSLSKRSKLGYPKYEEYALLKSNSLFEEVHEKNPDLIVQDDYVKIQKWKYDPSVLSSSEMVDPISLICSLHDEDDERIQMSLEEVLKEVDAWQITKN